MQHHRQLERSERGSFAEGDLPRARANGPNRGPWRREAPNRQSWQPTGDTLASANRFRAEADYADWLAKSATDPEKTRFYEGLAAHFRRLGEDIASPTFPSSKTGTAPLPIDT